jgi:hypothetical protein
MNNKNNDRIRTLLSKYYEGNTTLGEEKELISFFCQNSISEEFSPVKKQFELLHKARSLTIPGETLENSIIDTVMAYELMANRHQKKRTLNHYMIAASVALLVGISSIWIYTAQKKQPHDTFTDPKLAYIETQNALLLISHKLNKGIEPLTQIEKINTGKNQLKNLGKMDESLEMLNLVSFVNKSSNIKK